MKESDFHELVGGRRREDGGYQNQMPAPLIREAVVKIRRRTGMTNSQIAEKLCVSGSTLSRACGGRAGTKLGEDGISTTQRIFEGLKGF